ncbi:hypothetical protein LDO32_05355 [Luteimonas sp. Y-2-2-4F]|nr:hypothetical protein [Luteimonas sp. Y-2-2-4F]MCD9031156.1 hypothetical protein [Luteimonas sp. Y-2-2-4F]
MTPLDAELLLAAGIVAFYLFDSARLLHVDELLVESRGRGWRVRLGSRLELRGRFVWLPNALLPARTALPASWLAATAGDGDDPEALRRFAHSLWPVRAGCIVAGALVLAAIPALLLAAHDPVWLLATLVAALLVTAAMLAVVFRQRAALRLDRRKFLALAAESLLCPPCAPNLYRKLCGLRGFRGDPVAFAARHLAARERERLRDDIDARIALFDAADEGAGGAVADIRRAQARIREALA